MLKRHDRRTHGLRSRPAQETSQNASDHVLEIGNEPENEAFLTIPSTQLGAAEVDNQASVAQEHLNLFDASGVALDWDNMDLGDTQDLTLAWDTADPREQGFAESLGSWTTGDPTLPPVLEANNLTSETFAGKNTLDASSDITWDLTKTQLQDYERFKAAVHEKLPGYEALSYHTLRRYIQGYVGSFDQALPFIHKPLMCLRFCKPEVVLGMAAIGAHERSEPHSSLTLFQASKKIALGNLRTWKSCTEAQRTPLLRHTFPLAAGPQVCISDAENEPTRHAAMESLRALLMVSFYGLWSDASLLQDAVDSQSLMIEVARFYGLAKEPEQPSATITWNAWTHEETDRRTKFVLFYFLNLQTVMNDVPSPVLCSEWQLRMPCPADLWDAQHEQEWMVKSAMSEPIFFQDIFQALLSLTESGAMLEIKFTKALSQFNCNIIILALLQRIYYLRQLCDASGDTLRQEEIQRIQ